MSVSLYLFYLSLSLIHSLSLSLSLFSPLSVTPSHSLAHSLLFLQYSSKRIYYRVGERVPILSCSVRKKEKKNCRSCFVSVFLCPISLPRLCVTSTISLLISFVCLLYYIFIIFNICSTFIVHVVYIFIPLLVRYLSSLSIFEYEMLFFTI